MGGFVVVGLATALLVGVGVGWLRYWIGYFLIVQAGVSALLIAWISVGLYTRLATSRGLGLPALSYRQRLLLALLWVSTFLVGQSIGIGLAQPWFDPLGWLARVVSGESSELLFGFAGSGAGPRGIALGASGALRAVLGAVDLAGMWFLSAVFIGYWIAPEEGTPDAPEGPVQPAWAHWANRVGWTLFGLWLAGLALNFRPQAELKGAHAALAAGDRDMALVLSRRAAAFGPSSAGFQAESSMLQALAADALGNHAWAEAKAASALSLDSDNLKVLSLRTKLTGAAAFDPGPRADTALDQALAAGGAVPIDLVPLLVQRARARLGAGDLAGARSDLEAALESRQDDPDVHYLLSEVLEADGQWQAALQACDTAIRLAMRQRRDFIMDFQHPKGHAWLDRHIELEKKSKR